MIEYLMGYVDKLEELISESLNTTDHIGNDIRKEIDDRYTTLIEMKKLILEDLSVYFIDNEIREVKSMPQPSRDVIKDIMDKWMRFCNKYPAYLDRKKIKEYMINQLVEGGQDER